MKVKRIVFVNRAPFEKLELDNLDRHVVSLTGINGAGKTTILSYIVDAFYEIAKKAYRNEFAGSKEGKYYRVASSLFDIDRTKSSLVYILFELNGKEIHYIDMAGIGDENGYTTLMSNVWGNLDVVQWPIQYKTIFNGRKNVGHNIKYIKIDEEDARYAFQNNLITYFPSYRYEQPGYLNDIYQMQLSYKYRSDYLGYMANPIEVTSDLPEIANWIMDVVLDNSLYQENDVINTINYLVSHILIHKQNRLVRVGIGQRYLGGARIQIVDRQSSQGVYPSIFNISAGEAALLSMFGELIKQTDKLRKKIDDIEGIVVVDEIDKHLHIVLQKEVIPNLILMFPKVQFILSTHSTFVNIGLKDDIKNESIVFDLDNGGIECEADNNTVFREAYDVVVKDNMRYEYLYNTLKENVKNITKPIVYLEGRTDEKYFRRAFEVFDYKCDIDFKWIGHIDSNGNEEFTGSKSLNYAIQFLKGRQLGVLQFFIFDCDTNKDELDENNIVVITMPKRDNQSAMNKGIENSLDLEGIELDMFYDEHVKRGDYGNEITSKELNKMKMCNYICGLSTDELKKVFVHIKPVIDRIVDRLSLLEK